MTFLKFRWTVAVHLVNSNPNFSFSSIHYRIEGSKQFLALFGLAPGFFEPLKLCFARPLRLSLQTVFCFSCHFSSSEKQSIHSFHFIHISTLWRTLLPHPITNPSLEPPIFLFLVIPYFYFIPEPLFGKPFHLVPHRYTIRWNSTTKECTSINKHFIFL